MNEPVQAKQTHPPSVTIWNLLSSADEAMVASSNAALRFWLDEPLRAASKIWTKSRVWKYVEL